jgi:molybdopterin synthase catalytic subunit
MKITVRYFALLRERLGRDAEELCWDDAEPTVERLRRHLAERNPDAAAFLAGGALLVAVNREYAAAAVRLKDGDEVALFPPVTGGQDATGAKPRDKVRVQREPFDAAAELERLKAVSRRIGGVVLFVGIVRDFSRGRGVTKILFEHFPGMAEAKLAELRDEAIRRFGLVDLVLVHRVGELAPGDDIVLIAAAAEHRAAAFDGCSWCIDELKKSVPIWKKEHAPDGAVWLEAHP